MIATAKSIGDQERLADGLNLNIYDHLELGHVDQIDNAFAARKRIAEEIKQPFQMHVAVVFQTMRVILHVEFKKAEKLRDEPAFRPIKLLRSAKKFFPAGKPIHCARSAM